MGKVEQNGHGENPLRRITGKIGWRPSAFVVFLCLVAWLFMFTDSPLIRYQPELVPQFEKIYNEQGEVDIAVMGSSRFMRAFNARELADEYMKATGKKIVVYDIARSYRDWGHAYVTIRDLLENRSVDMIFFELNRSRGWIHHDFKTLARMRDIPESCFLASNDPLLKKAGESLYLLLKRPCDLITNTLTGEIDWEMKETPVDAYSSDCNSFPVRVDPKALARRRKAYQATWKNSKGRAWDPEHIDESRGHHYLRKLTRLAREHQTRLIFMHIPASYLIGLNLEFQKRLEKELDAEIWRLPIPLLEELYERNLYADGAHMKESGRALVMKWLANRLATEKGI